MHLVHILGDNRRLSPVGYFRILVEVSLEVVVCCDEILQEPVTCLKRCGKREGDALPPDQRSRSSGDDQDDENHVYRMLSHEGHHERPWT